MIPPSGASRRRWTEAGMDDSIRQPPRLEDVERILEQYLPDAQMR